MVKISSMSVDGICTHTPSDVLIVHALVMQAGVDKEGRIMAIDVDMYNNGGYSPDLSQAVRLPVYQFPKSVNYMYMYEMNKFNT